jgi:hypothetical protein
MLLPSSLPPMYELPRPFAPNVNFPRSTLGADGNRIVAFPVAVKRSRAPVPEYVNVAVAVVVRNVPSAFCSPVNTIVPPPETRFPSLVPVNYPDPVARVSPITVTFPETVTGVGRPRPGTSATPAEADPTTSTTPSNTLNATRPAVCENNTMRSP